MKKLFVLTVLLLFVIGLPGATLANGLYSNAAQSCKDNDNWGYSSFGKCVSILRACEGPGNTDAVCTCKVFLDTAPSAFFVAYNNMGECINYERFGYVFE